MKNKYYIFLGLIIASVGAFLLFPGCKSDQITENDAYLSGMILGDIWVKEKSNLHDNDRKNIELGFSILYSALMGDFKDKVDSIDATVKKFVDDVHDANIISDVLLLAYNKLQPEIDKLIEKVDKINLFQEFLDGFVKRAQIDIIIEEVELVESK